MKVSARFVIKILQLAFPKFETLENLYGVIKTS